MKLIQLLHKENTRDRIAKFQGRVCTTLGTGWVSQIITITDANEIAPQLHECLTPEAFDAEPDLWRDAFEDYIQWCLNTAVVVRDASINNIVVKPMPSGELRFIVIDGIGPRGSFPRWVPLKRYANKRNKAYLDASEFSSIENLVDFCKRFREDPYYRRDTLVEEPADGVVCLITR